MIFNSIWYFYSVMLAENSEFCRYLAYIYTCIDVWHKLLKEIFLYGSMLIRHISSVLCCENSEAVSLKIRLNSLICRIAVHVA